MQKEQSELAKFWEAGSKGEKKLRESQRRNSELAKLWEPGSKGKKFPCSVHGQTKRTWLSQNRGHLKWKMAILWKQFFRKQVSIPRGFTGHVGGVWWVVGGGVSILNWFVMSVWSAVLEGRAGRIQAQWRCEDWLAMSAMGTAVDIGWYEPFL